MKPPTAETKGDVTAFDLATGKEKWRKEVPGGVVGCAAIADVAAFFKISPASDVKCVAYMALKRGTGGKADEWHGVAESQRAGSDERRVFAEAMARHDRGRGTAGFTKGPVDGVGGRQHDGLGVRREIQILGGPFGNQLAEVLTERVGGFLEGFAHDCVIGERVQHAHRLRSLPRKNERKFHIVLKCKAVSALRAHADRPARVRPNRSPAADQ